MWTPVFTTFPIINRVRGYFEVNPRFDDGMEGFNQLLIRPALLFRVNDCFSFGPGYAWVTNYLPFFLQEQRVYQEFRLKHRLLGAPLLHRFRLEQRFIEGLTQTSNRFRYMLRGEYPLGKSSCYLVAYEELFVNLNSIRGGPQRGIDQNRIFVGMGRQFGRKVKAEIGYQHQYINRSDIFDQGNHILLMQAFIDF